MASTLVKSAVMMAALGEKTYECYLVDGDWNGWACPFFTEKVADEIAKDINSDLTSHLKIDKSYSESKIPVYSEYDFCALETPYDYEGQLFDVDGEKKILIPLGNSVWMWEEVD